MNEDKYKNIYKSLMPVYHEDEDYCRIAIDKLRYTIAHGDRAQIADAYAELTRYFNDLTETVNIASKRFKQVCELLDECFDDNRNPEIDEEWYSVYCVGGGLFLSPREIRRWVSDILPEATLRRAWYHVPFDLEFRQGLLVCEVDGEHGTTYRVLLLKCCPTLDIKEGEYSLNGIIRLLTPHKMGYGANMISRRLRKVRDGLRSDE